MQVDGQADRDDRARATTMRGLGKGSNTRAEQLAAEAAAKRGGAYPLDRRSTPRLPLSLSLSQSVLLAKEIGVTRTGLAWPLVHPPIDVRNAFLYPTLQPSQ